MKFVYNEPAVVSGDKLVIGDLHIGLESELSRSGVNAPNQTQEMMDRVSKMLFQNNCSELIILGDLKHGIPWAEWEEKESLRDFVEEMKRKADLTIVKGNHDASIEEYINTEVAGPHGYRNGDEYFLHGHAEPREEAFECKKIYMSHLHAVLKLTDSLGKTTSQKIWLTGETEKEREKAELVIVPSFNRLISGQDVRESFIGPMKKYLDPGELKAHLLDGTDLGKLRELPRKNSS